MVKFIILGLLVFFCFLCCKQKAVELRGVELCKLINENGKYGNNQVDSLVQLSVRLSKAERYAVLCCGITRLRDDFNDQIARYLQELRMLERPQVKDKETALMLLGCYGNNRFTCDGEKYNLRDIAPWAYDPEWIASLLFDLEHRWQLTPQEKIYFLLRKAELYLIVFKEYKSSRLIMEEGLRLACKYGIDSTLMMSYYASWSIGSSFEGKEERALQNERFAELADSLGFDAHKKKSIYQVTGIFYMQAHNYPKAYEWLSRTGLCTLPYSLVVPVYLGMDSIPEALAFLQKKKETIRNPLQLASIAWYEALIRRQMADYAGYENGLRKSLEIFDTYPMAVEVEFCAVSKAYAELLWQRGQRAEAIRRMEFATKKLLSLGKKADAFVDKQWSEEQRLAILDRFQLLRNYYNRVGRSEDALRQSLLCDTLEAGLTAVRLQYERERVATATYSAELARSLEFKSLEFERERLRLYFSWMLLGVALLALIALGWLYRRRQRVLNVLYARQKEIELLKTEKWQAVTVNEQKISPEEKLFRDLERQFHEEELFRNPGFSRDDLCRLGGSNRMYVSTCINRYAGTNINQWINKARIDYAIRLIGEGEDDLTKLSEQSGFASLKSFFRSFKQFTELTPRQYIVRERQSEKQSG